MAAVADAKDAALIREDLRGQVMSGDARIPMLPATASQILAASTDEHSTAERIAVIVQRDPAIAAEMLRVVNSAAVRGAAPVVSLTQAVARLGLARVRDIALGVAVGKALFAAPRYRTELQALWRRGVATALWSREIGRQCRRFTDTAYLCGLFSRAGDAVVLRVIALGGEFLLTTTALDLARGLAPAAMDRLGESWGLPAFVLRSLGSGQPGPERAIVLAADALAMDLAPLPGDVPADLGVLFEPLDLYEDDVATLRQGAAAVGRELGSMLA